EYSETTKKVVFGIARMLGYYSTSSTAIRTSRDLYNVCAKQVEENKKFYHQDCNLPDNFQTWFSITQVHVWMLMVRLRAEDHGKIYIQELVNRFFEDAEDRIRSHGVWILIDYLGLVITNIDDKFSARIGYIWTYSG
ncbi:hypothetical protein BC943DRAFT_272319, partial [Umbelopsis sp. AD052]